MDRTIGLMALQPGQTQPEMIGAWSSQPLVMVIYLIGVEMQAPSEQQVFTDAENILNEG